MQTHTTLTVAQRYADALAAKDFAAVAAIFADDIVWHQPGSHRFSGTHQGANPVNELLGGMMTHTQGTFELTVTGEPMANNDLVVLPVHFAGTTNDRTMDMDGVDLLRIDTDRIAEVWLFSTDQPAEDAFWGND